MIRSFMQRIKHYRSSRMTAAVWPRQLSRRPLFELLETRRVLSASFNRIDATPNSDDLFALSLSRTNAGSDADANPRQDFGDMVAWAAGVAESGDSGAFAQNEQAYLAQVLVPIGENTLVFRRGSIFG